MTRGAAPLDREQPGDALQSILNPPSKDLTAHHIFMVKVREHCLMRGWEKVQYRHEGNRIDVRLERPAAGRVWSMKFPVWFPEDMVETIPSLITHLCDVIDWEWRRVAP